MKHVNSHQKIVTTGLLVVVWMFTMHVAIAQSIANYAFTNNVTGSLALDMNANTVDMSTGTTQLISTSVDDQASGVLSIGFNFNFMGKVFTQFSASSNGIVMLGSTAVGNAAYSSNVATATSPCINSFAGDLKTGSNGKVHYKVIGTAPNRVLVVEFLNQSLDWITGTVTGDGTYQTRLYETSGIIEFVYGNMFRNSSATNSASETFNIGIASGTTATTRLCIDTNNVVSYGTLAVNNYPLSANMAKIHSTSNGNRTTYILAPPSATSLVAPTSLSFSAVAASSMTLNWVESSPATGVTAYAIFNSTDGINYNFVTSVPVGTSTYAASGLITNTSYSWKVYAMTEGMLMATSLDGVQSTLPASTYTWNVVSGSWTTAGNWTPSRTAPDATDILMFNNAGVGTTQTATDVPTQTIARLVVDNGITVNLQATATSTLTIASDNTPADELSVTSGSALISNGTAAALTIRYSGTGSTGTIAGTLEATSTTGSTTNNAFDFSNGTSTVTTISGTLATGQSGGTGVPAITSSASSLIFAATGTYNYKFTTSAGTVPTAAWQAGSTCAITGITSSTSSPSGLAQTFANFTWNCAGQTGNVSMGGTVPTVSGTFTVSNTGSGQLRAASTSSSAFNVNNFVQSGGIFELNSGAGSMSLNVSGSFTHSGGTFCAATAGTPILNFTGSTGAQNVSFFNAAPTGALTYRVSNGMGINLLGTGTLTTTFNINSGGGVRVTSKASTPINTVLTLAYNATGTTLTYDTTASYSMTALEFPATGGPANLTVNVGAGNVITMPPSFTSRALSPAGANGVLTMTSGDMDINSNTFTLGTSAAFTGTLSYTAGAIRVTTGSLTRFFGTSGLPTSATASAGQFPIATGTKSRTVGVSFSSATALSTGGSITVSHNGAVGLTSTSVTDGAYTVDTRTNGSWTFTHSGLVATGTLSVRLTGGSMFGTTAVANIRMVQSAGAAGTYSAGTGSSPNFQANRTGLTLTDFAQTHYIGAASADIMQLILSVATGDWGTPSTWDIGAVPTCASQVTIAAGHTVTVNSATNQSKNLTVQTGGTLAVTSGDLTVGCTLNNTPLTINGTLTVSGGVLNVNGNINLVSGGVFTQSGGNINVDGNAGGVAANSVAGSTSLIALNVANATSVNFTGGTLTIVDPHANSTATTVLTLSGSFNGPVNGTSGHTLRFGDGVSTDAGGNATNGFRVNTWASTSGLPLGNVIVEGPAGTNRHVTSEYNQPILGDLTINSGADFRMAIVLLNGNLTVNTGGSYTSTNSLTLTLASFLDVSNLTIAQSPNAQTITNNGTMQNLLATPTANLTALTINNTNATGVTFNSPISVSGTLSLAKGKINTTTANIVRLGTPNTSGTLAGGSDSAYFTGPFARTFAASRAAGGTYTVATLYPVGKGSTYIPIWVDPSTNAGGATIISGEAFTSNSGTMGPAVTSLSTNRWEALITSGAANFTSTNIQLADGAALLSSNKILQATTAGGAYGGIIPAIAFAAGTPNTIRTTGSQILAANYSGYFAYGDLTPCIAPVDQPTSLVTSALSNTSFTGSFTAAASTPSHYIIVRYSSGATPTAPVDYTSYTAGATLGTGSVVVVTTQTTFNETGLTGGTTYDYYIYSMSNSACFGPVYNTVSPLTGSVTTCAAAIGTPAIASGENISSTGFTARWAYSSTPSATYEIDLATDAGFTAFVPGFQALSVGTDSFYVFTGLTASTTYYTRVRAISGSCYSTSSSSSSVTTACTPFAVLPYNEQFNTIGVLPTCWNRSVISGTAQWDVVTNLGTDITAPASGTGFLCKTWQTSDALVMSNPFDLTVLPLSAKAGMAMYLHRHASAHANDRYQIYLNVYPTLTGAVKVLDMYSLTTSAPAVPATGWYPYEIDIPDTFNMHSHVYIIFQGTTTAGATSYALGVDSLRISQAVNPLMLTGSNGAVTQTTASITGNSILFNGFSSVTASGIVYGTSPAPAIGDPGVVDSTTNPLVTNGSYSFNLTGLTGATTYYYRAYATNSAGTGYGADSSFTTPAAPLPASITIAAATNITVSSATVGGNITSDGGTPVTTSGVVVSTSPNPAIGDPGVTDITTSPLVTTGSFTVSASGLASGTKYYYRAYAINGVGTAYSSVQDSFNTGVLISTLPYNQDFEGTANTGWTVTTEPTYDNNWVLGTPAKLYLNGAHSGTNAWVTNLSADYDDDVLSSVVSPQFDFSSLAADPVLRFYHKYVTESNYDAMVVEVSINGGLWTRLDMTLGTGANYNNANSYSWYTSVSTNGPIDNAKFTSTTSGDGSDLIYSSQNNGWIESATRLTGAAGQSNVKFRFTFGSDVSGTYEGWTLDDIEVVDVTTPSVAASAVVTSNITNTTTDVSWTNGNGQGRLVVARLTSTPAVAPTDNKLYSGANTVFSTPADSTGAGNYIVYYGASSPVTVTGLDLVTDYTYDVYEYNGKYMHIRFSTAASNNATTLPVKLVAFTAKALSDDVLTTWSTASETNNRGFDVERSLDGITFEKAGFVKGAGNSSRMLNYSFTDAKAFALTNSKVLYYRLRQVDMDGKFSYSNVVRVSKNAEKANALSVFPNPFDHQYSISFMSADAGTVTLKMTDMQGKVVAAQTATISKGLNEISVDNLNTLQAGVYFVKITIDGETQVMKLVKN